MPRVSSKTLDAITGQINDLAHDLGAIGPSARIYLDQAGAGNQVCGRKPWFKLTLAGEAGGESAIGGGMCSSSEAENTLRAVRDALYLAKNKKPY